ncbi:MAG: hypothetical protein AB1611_19330 [bacterium]
MKKVHDFSEGERGKFYKAEKKNSDLSTVVNNLIKIDMQLAEFVK